MSISVFVVMCFLIMFALVVLTISAGLNFMESRKKRKVSEMLRSAGGTPAVPETRVLIETVKVSAVSLAKLIARFNFARKMEANIQQAGLTTSLNTLLIQMLVMAVVGTLAGRKFVLVTPWLSSLALAVVFGLIPYLYVLHRRRQRLALFEGQLPEALDFLARAMRAGHAFTISLEMLSDESAPPLGVEFRKVFNEHNLGLPIETALTNLTIRVPLLDVKFFVSAVLLQRETGGNLSEILIKLAFIIRERFKLKGQVKALSAHGRITGMVLTIMPIALMLGLLVIAPGYLQGMAADPDGKYMIGGAIVAMLLGHFTIRKIIDIKV
jgi:tight adherence protein B